MSHQNVLDSGDCILVVVDLQDRVLNTIYQADRVVNNSIKLIECAKIFSIPILVTVQYKDKMGPTTQSVLDVLPDDVMELDKTTFSCMGGACFEDLLKNNLRKQVLLCGIETHICINQTAHDLLARGYSVHICEDAVSSRILDNKQIAIRKMEHSGCVITSTEMSIFELTRDASRAEFKKILPLVK